MTDSWEILGRLAADATFWGDVKKAALSAPPRPGANGRSAIPEGDYKKALDTVRNAGTGDRKSTRLNSSHLVISYAVFCLKKKHDLRANALNLSKVGALHLKSDRGFDSGQFHVEAIFHRHGPGVGNSFFFFNDTAPTEIYPLSLPDALPIYVGKQKVLPPPFCPSLSGQLRNFEGV